MLWAEFQPKNDAEAVGFFVGVMMAGLVSGAIPFVTGLVTKQVPLALTGGILSAGAGALAGCCLGIPVALLFTIIIVVVASCSAGAGRGQRARPDLDYDDYDDYSRPFRAPDGRPARRPAPRADDRPEAEDDWRRRAEDEEHFRARGFRPRRRGDDPTG